MGFGAVPIQPVVKLAAVAVDALAQALGELIVWATRRAAEAAKRKRPRKCEDHKPKHMRGGK